MRKMEIGLVELMEIQGCKKKEKDVQIGKDGGDIIGGIEGGGRGELIGEGEGDIGGMIVSEIRRGK